MTSTAGTVVYIADERKEASLDALFRHAQPDDQLAGIEAVAMDMWEPYANSVRAHLDEADNKIVFDRFHFMKYLNTAVDTVRKAEHRALRRRRRRLAGGSKYLWLVLGREPPRAPRRSASPPCAAPISRPPGPGPSRRTCVTSGSTTARAGPRSTGRAGTSGPPTRGSQPVIDAAYTLKRHQAGCLSYFDHRITSAPAEGLNSRIQAIRVHARGYRNREHFKTAIYFHLGGLDLYPRARELGPTENPEAPNYFSRFSRNLTSTFQKPIPCVNE